MFKVSGLWFGVSSLGLRVSHLGASATAQCLLELSTVYRLLVLATATQSKAVTDRKPSTRNTQYRLNPNPKPRIS